MFDCIIIGAGISGTSLAFELSKYNGSVLVLEKHNDVACETTKANSAIIHAGYDPKPNTKMAKYNVLGNRLVVSHCHDLDVEYKEIGSLVIAFDSEDLKTLDTLFKRGIANGVKDLRIVEKEELLRMEPNLNPDVLAALYAPSAGIVNPWQLAIAYSEVAYQNGVKFHFNEEVIQVIKTEECFIIKTQKNEYKSKLLVNAAGTHCADVLKLVKCPNYHIVPNKGEYYLLDKSQGELIHHVIFQCPSKVGKGILVAPTVHGNLIVGPTSEICDMDDVSTSSEGLNYIKAKAILSVPSINFKENIRNFSGVRARTDVFDDFIVQEEEDVPNFYQIAGMCSPGLSSASAIAQDVRKWACQKGYFINEKPEAVTTRKIIRFKQLNHEQRTQWIKEHPAYGRIICRCEMVSEGEIIDAIKRMPCPISLDAIKRRCNSGMGRCQGGFCGPRIQELIAREKQIDPCDVIQDQEGSILLYKRTKE